MADSTLVVRRCTNCGQEYDLASGLRECKACHQPLGYWCKRDSETSGSWLSGPECRQCVKREERNRKRREQRKKKRDATNPKGLDTSLFDGLETVLSEPSAGERKTRGGREARRPAAKDRAGEYPAGDRGGDSSPAPASPPPVPAGGKASPAPAPPPLSRAAAAPPARPLWGTTTPAAPSANIAANESAGVVRRCMNCGTEYAPHGEIAECDVCFNRMGWWCRTHSPAGGAWLSGASCPLCAAMPPAPRSAPKPRPPIVAVPPRRTPPPHPRPTIGSVPEEKPFLSPSVMALGCLYALVFLMALTQVEALESDLRLIIGAVTAGSALLALRFRVTAALVMIAVFWALAGSIWLLTQEPLSAGLFAVGSLLATRLKRARFLAVGICYISVLYAFLGAPLLEFFGVQGALFSPPSLPGVPAPARTGGSRATGAETGGSAVAKQANPDLDVIPTRMTEPRMFEGHLAPVYTVAYLPGGRSLLSLGRDQMLRTWTVSTGSQAESHPMPRETAALLYSYSGGGDLLSEVRAMTPQSVLIWNSRSNALVGTYNLSAPASSLAFSPTGNTLAVGMANGAVAQYDVATGSQIRTLPSPVGGPVKSVALSAERNLLAAAGPRGIAIWNLANLGPGSSPLHLLEGMEANRTFAAQFTPSGRTLMTVSTRPNVSADLVIRYWDTTTGALLRTVESEKTYPADFCTIRPDGRQIACASRSDMPGDRRIYVYDLTGP